MLSCVGLLILFRLQKVLQTSKVSVSTLAQVQRLGIGEVTIDAQNEGSLNAPSSSDAGADQAMVTSGFATSWPSLPDHRLRSA